jgi:hypothetical protein
LWKESQFARQKRQCLSSGVCLCTGHNQQTLTFLTAWREEVQKMLRKPNVTLAALRGPNEWRAAADSGQLVIRLEDLRRKGDAQWDFLAYVRHQPLRPALLRMTEVASSPIPK